MLRDVKIGDKVLGPSPVVNPNTRKEIVMTVKAVDTMENRDGLRFVDCAYTLNDQEHVETFREDSLRPA